MAITAVLLITACSGGGDGDDTPRSSATETSADIRASAGGTVRLGDASITIPPGALTADARVTIRSETSTLQAPDPAPLALVLGEPFQFGIQGATLQSAATVTVPYDPAQVPAESEAFPAFAAGYDAVGRSWLPEASTADPAHRTVSEQTQQVSWTQAWTWLVPAAREALTQVVTETFRLTAGGASQPVCEREPPPGAELPAMAGDAFLACLGSGDDAAARLAVANNRPFSVVLDRPGSASVRRAGRGPLYGALDEMLGEVLPSAVYLPGGEAADLDLSPPPEPTTYELAAAPRAFSVALDLLTRGIEVFAPGATDLVRASGRCVVDGVGTGDSFNRLDEVAVVVVDCLEKSDRSNPVTIALARLRDTLASTLRSTDLVEDGQAAGASRVRASWSPREELTATSRLRLDGIGPVKVGMSLEEASSVSGLTFSAPDGGPDPARCGFVRAERGPPDVAFMVKDNTTIVRIDVTGPAIETDTGLRVGSTEDEVKAAYPGISERPHLYRVPDGHYLTHVPDDEAVRGFELLFETDGRTVTAFRTGVIADVEAPEGCA